MALATTTRSEARTFARDLLNGTNAAGDVRLVDRAIARTLDDLYGEHRWSFYTTYKSVSTVGGRGFVLAADLDAGDTTVTATASTPAWSTNEHAGRFLDIGGQCIEILSNTATVLTLVSAYQGETIDSGDSGTIYVPGYDMPDNCEQVLSVRPATNWTPKVTLLTSVDALFMQRSVQVGQAAYPTHAAWGSYDNDGRASRPRLWLAPNPLGPAVGADDDDSLAAVYNVCYFRRWGWFGSDGLWKRESAADGDILDWPESHKSVLDLGCQYHVALETLAASSVSLETAYTAAKAKAKQVDRKVVASFALGGGRGEFRKISDTVDYFGARAVEVG